jgi:hypothetical protein
MADLTILKESREILKQMGATCKEEGLLCPILKVLQMRHAKLDMAQATRVVKRVLHE